MKVLFKFVVKHLWSIYTSLSALFIFLSILFIYLFIIVDEIMLLNDPYKTIDLFYSISLIGLSCFSGFAFIYLYENNKDFLNIELNKINNFLYQLRDLEEHYKKIKKQSNKIIEYKIQLESNKHKNLGIALLAMSVLVWQLGGLLYLWNSIQHQIPIPYHFSIQEIISTINSAFLLGVVSTFQFNKNEFPRWWNKFPYNFFRSYKNLRNISAFVITCIILLMIFYPNYDPNVNKEFTTRVLLELPDLTFSFITIIILWRSIKAVFKSRKIKYSGLVNFTFVTILIAQNSFLINNLLENSYFWNLLLSPIIGLFFKIALLALLFALSYSWKFFIDNQTIKTLNDFNEKALSYLKNEVDKQVLLKQQMNHAIRGSISYLRDTTDEYYNKHSVKEVIEDMRSRIIGIYELHDFLHKSKDPTEDVFIGSYLKDLSKSIGKAHNYIEGSQLKLEFGFLDFKILFDHAKDLGIVLTELLINSIKALKNQPNNRLIIINGFIENEMLILLVNDNGPGFDFESINKGYGFEIIDVILKDFKGSFKKKFSNKGALIEVKIPYSPIKISQ